MAKVRKGGKKAAVQATLDICALFRNHPDADIYTSFYSDRGAKSRDEGASLMSGCAEDLDNFWDVEKASDIPDAFQSFGDSIMKVSTKRPSIIH